MSYKLNIDDVQMLLVKEYGLSDKKADDLLRSFFAIIIKALEEGGYEPTCHLEYCLKGPLKKGVTRLYADSFRAVFEKLHGKL